MLVFSLLDHSLVDANLRSFFHFCRHSIIHIRHHLADAFIKNTYIQIVHVLNSIYKYIKHLSIIHFVSILWDVCVCVSVYRLLPDILTFSGHTRTRSHPRHLKLGSVRSHKTLSAERTCMKTGGRHGNSPQSLT